MTTPQGTGKPCRHGTARAEVGYCPSCILYAPYVFKLRVDRARTVSLYDPQDIKNLFIKSLGIFDFLYKI